LNHQQATIPLLRPQAQLSFLQKKKKTHHILKMKAAFVLAALATLVMAAPQIEEDIPYLPVIEVGEAEISAEFTYVDTFSLYSGK
jgi:hypothetical protein